MEENRFCNDDQQPGQLYSLAAGSFLQTQAAAEYLRLYGPGCLISGVIGSWCLKKIPGSNKKQLALGLYQFWVLGPENPA